MMLWKMDHQKTRMETICAVSLMLIHAPLCQKCKHTESDKLSVQIQAYLDNVFDVGGLLEDAETKNAALEKVEELEEHLSHVSAPPSLDHQRCLFGTSL